MKGGERQAFVSAPDENLECQMRGQICGCHEQKNVSQEQTRQMSLAIKKGLKYNERKRCFDCPLADLSLALCRRKKNSSMHFFASADIVVKLFLLLQLLAAQPLEARQCTQFL